MSDESFALAVAVVVFAGAVMGLFLQRYLPEKYTTGPPRDAIGAVAGLLTLLSALVLGLMIWTAYGVYSGQNIAIQTLAAKILQLDFALTDYGPEASAGRAQLRQDLANTITRTWSDKQGGSEFRRAPLRRGDRDFASQGRIPRLSRPFDGRPEAGAGHGHPND